MENIIQDQDAIEAYINHVFMRGNMLIENRLWNGIDIFRYRSWWKKFLWYARKAFSSVTH